MRTLSDIQTLWMRIEQVLKKHVPSTAQTLAPPATESEIAQLEGAIELDLPEEFRCSLRIHNGQIDPTGCHSFIIGGPLATTTRIAETWRMLNEVDEHLRRTVPDWDNHTH